MMDRASWEFTDLRSRMNMLESREELDANDILRPHVLARIVTSSWLAAPLGFDAWRLLQSVVHEELSLFAEEAYHETNRFLLQRHVLPEVDLRPVHPALEPRRAAAAARLVERRLRHADRHVAERRGRVPVVGEPSERGERGRRGDAPDDARRRPGAQHRPGRGGARPAESARRSPAARLRHHLARAGAAVAAPERGDRRGAGGRRAPPVGRGRCRRQRRPPGRQHAGAARGAAPAEAGAQAGRGDAGRAGDDRDRRPAVPEHPDGRRDSRRRCASGSRACRCRCCASPSPSPTSSPPSSTRRAA